MAWRRSSRCESHTCVEVATLADGALVRDSKDHEAGVLTFDTPAWSAFLGMVRRGTA